MARPRSASNASRLATSTTLIPDAAICRANSLPIPDEAPVTSAHGPNCPLSSVAFIVLFLSDDCTCCSIVQSHSADPIFQALYLHHHQVGVIGRVCHRSHTLKSTEEARKVLVHPLHGRPPGIGPRANCGSRKS